jgi:hypothetical protein
MIMKLEAVIVSLYLIFSLSVFDPIFTTMPEGGLHSRRELFISTASQAKHEFGFHKSVVYYQKA